MAYRPFDSNTSRANTASNGDMKSKCSFPSDMQVFVICGYDDGTVSVTEITSALAFIGKEKFSLKTLTYELIMFMNVI